MDLPFVSAIISTRNRGATIVPAVESIMLNEYPAFELIVVDQSSNNETARAIEPYRCDPRLRYIRTDTRGTSIGQNLAISKARGSLVAITDDDCVVDSHWIATLVQLFAEHQNVGLIYCRVIAGPHDSSKGFIPTTEFIDNVILKELSDFEHRLGIGAGIAIRRQTIDEVGGFDEYLGPGGRFRSGADQDFGIRVLAKHRHVMLTDKTWVVHHGFRTWEDGKELTSRYFFGIGALCQKPLRVGHFGILRHILRRVAIDCLWFPLSRVLRGKKPQGLRRLPLFLYGFLASMRMSIDASTLRFVE